MAYSAKQQVAQRGNNCSTESQLCHENILNFFIVNLRKPIGDISLDGLGKDWTLRGYILHLNDIWDLNILLYLENVGLAGNYSCDMMGTDESFIGDVSIFLLLN